MSTTYLIIEPSGSSGNVPRGMPSPDYELPAGYQLSVYDRLHGLEIRAPFFWESELGTAELIVDKVGGMPFMDLHVQAPTVAGVIELRRRALKHLGYEVGAPPPQFEDILPALEGRWNRLIWLLNWIWTGSLS
jgi:hypothetical protein